jgi:hypothetical protein
MNRSVSRPGHVPGRDLSTIGRLAKALDEAKTHGWVVAAGALWAGR